MVEITDNRCYVLWIKNKRGKVSNEPTIFTTAHAAITQGERLKDKGIIEDYNYSIVICPQMSGEPVSNLKAPILKELTTSPQSASIQL